MESSTDKQEQELNTSDTLVLAQTKIYLERIFKKCGFPNNGFTPNIEVAIVGENVRFLPKDDDSTEWFLNTFRTPFKWDPVLKKAVAKTEQEIKMSMMDKSLNEISVPKELIERNSIKPKYSDQASTAPLNFDPKYGRMNRAERRKFIRLNRKTLKRMNRAERENG